MSNPKFVVMEVTPETMMLVIETLAMMLVNVKENPRLLTIIPPDPGQLVVRVMQMTIEKVSATEQPEPPSTPEAQKAAAETASELFEKVFKTAGKH